MENTRTTYDGYFANQILSDFHSPDRHSDSTMDTADKFRNEEWRLDDDAPYAENTRNDLIKLGSNNLSLSVWIIEVINCMRYNRSMEEES
jgi:hypothetical protein